MEADAQLYAGIDYGVYVVAGGKYYGICRGKLFNTNFRFWNERRSVYNQKFTGTYRYI